MTEAGESADAGVPLAERIDRRTQSLTSNRFFPSLLMISAGAMLIFFSQMLALGVRTDASYQIVQWMGLAGLVLVVVGAASSSLAYLAGNEKKSVQPATTVPAPPARVESGQQALVLAENNLFDFQERAISEISRTLQASIALSPIEQKKLTQSIRRQITANLAAEIIQEVKGGKNWSIQENDIAQIRARCLDAKSRLSQEVAALTRRGNLNLVIGGATTLMAVALLVYVVMGATQSATKDIDALLWVYVPRLSIAVFIEIFSFFFLRLYRAGLDEIKYFQNELTNIDMRNIALESAFLMRDESALGRLIEELSRTERNFRLQKDESTVDLEKAKLESQSIKDFMAGLTNILKKDK